MDNEEIIETEETTIEEGVEMEKGFSKGKAALIGAGVLAVGAGIFAVVKKVLNRGDDEEISDFGDEILGVDVETEVSSDEDE